MQTDYQSYDLESEVELLASLYWQPENLYQVSVSAEDFYKPEHRKIFTAMLQCYGDGVRPDLKAVMDNGAPFKEAFDIFGKAFTDANLRYHEKKVLEKSFERNCERAALEIQKNVGAENFLPEAERIITDLQQRRNIQPEKSVKSILNDIHTEFMEAKSRGFYGIQTSFPKINDCCVGFCPRHLWLLGGMTSFGKSSILSQVIRDISLNEAAVLLFSVEDSRQDKITRLVSTVSGVTVTDIVRGYIKQEQYLKAAEEIADYNLVLYDDVYTIPDMDMKIKKHKLRGKVDLVAIDFVQNIITKGDGIYERMSEVAIGLQKMAKKHEVCILALSQVTGDKLRGAQELESAADIVLFGEREYGHEDFTLSIKKNRPFGKTGVINMTFANNWTAVKEISSWEGER